MNSSWTLRALRIMPWDLMQPALQPHQPQTRMTGTISAVFQVDVANLKFVDHQLMIEEDLQAQKLASLFKSFQDRLTARAVSRLEQRIDALLGSSPHDFFHQLSTDSAVSKLEEVVNGLVLRFDEAQVLYFCDGMQVLIPA